VTTLYKSSSGEKSTSQTSYLEIENTVSPEVRESWRDFFDRRGLIIESQDRGVGPQATLQGPAKFTLYARRESDTLQRD